MAGLLWPLLGVLAGAFVAAQAPINAELARGLGSTFAAATISFLSGTIVLGLLTFLIVRSQGTPSPGASRSHGCSSSAAASAPSM